MNSSHGHVSEEHFDRFVDEFALRYNNLKTTDAERAVKAIKKIEGKRLYYKDGVVIVLLFIDDKSIIFRR